MLFSFNLKINIISRQIFMPMKYRVISVMRIEQDTTVHAIVTSP